LHKHFFLPAFDDAPLSWQEHFVEHEYHQCTHALSVHESALSISSGHPEHLSSHVQGGSPSPPPTLSRALISRTIINVLMLKTTIAQNRPAAGDGKRPKSELFIAFSSQRKTGGAELNQNAKSWKCCFT
jgi:hypothetical protein